MAAKDDILDNVKNIKAQNDALKAQRDLAISINDLVTARAKQEEINLNKLLLKTQQERAINELKGKNNKLTEEEKKLLDDNYGIEKKINNELTKEQLLRSALVGTLREFNNQLKQGWDFLMKSDKVIKSTTLNLGLSSGKAELLRSSFEQSAGFVAKLGGNIEDIQTIMQGYADETGRARALTSEMINDITLIGKGTGLGIEQATKLGAQFEIMGIDAKKTVDYIQGVVETSERMGVNTTKVLKNVNDNFKKLNTFTFQQGAKGFAQMAMYSEKFKINMTDALNSATIAKGLEGAIDLAAQLQVMGGEFAKTDPFQMLFLSRNDPAKFTEKIADMTKGIVTFRKMSDGTFEKFISPADRDRLAQVAKSLGMEEGALTQIAQRTAEVQKMRQEMAGSGLSPKDKELVEGMAIFNSNTNKFAVQIGSVSKDISQIGANDIKVLNNQKATLEKRAKDALTFEDTFKATIAELKSALLPILRGINSTLEMIKPIAAPIVKFLTNNSIAPAWLKVGLTFISAAVAWKGITFGLDRAANNFITKGTFLSHLFGGKGKGGLGETMGNLDRNGNILNPGAQRAYDVGQVNRSNAAAGASKAAGMKNLMTGAGVGAAGLGIGGGIALAAVGISKLADSMSKLTPEQAKTLSSIVKSLGWFVIGGAAAAGAILLLGGASTAGAVGLLAFGGAVALVGVGIGAAASGIGFMGQGLSKMIDSAKNAGGSLSTVAGGISEISLAMAGTGIAGLLGGGGMFLGLKAIASQAPAIAEIGESFKQIKAVMSGSKDDFIGIQNAIESISKMNIKGGSMFSELSNILKNPIKVEFADKQVALVSNITMNIDGYKFTEATDTTGRVIQKTQEVKHGQGSLTGK